MSGKTNGTHPKPITGDCARKDCPGDRGLELAGGGMGAYLYCPLCERVCDKTMEV